MRRRLAFSLLACVACLGAVGLSAQNQATAQDVAITNARIVVGNGQVIESGTIIVRGGKIATVQAGAAIGGGQADANIALRELVESGKANGPAADSVRADRPQPDAAGSVSRGAGAGRQGRQAHREIGLIPEPAPPQSQIEVVKAIVDESRQHL